MTVVELLRGMEGYRTALLSTGFRDPDVLGGLLQPCDRGMDWVSGDDAYTWLYAFGYVARPRSGVEIGTRFGYSLWAVASGADLSGMDLTVYDAELDSDKDPLKVCEAWFAKQPHNLTVHRQNTQEMTYLNVKPVDYAMVDADHSEAGAYHDVRLVWPVVKPGGWILVDDTNPGDVRKAVDRFVAEAGCEFAHVRNFRGLSILKKK